MRFDATCAILTKSRAKYGSRLTAGNYRELMGQTSIADAAAYLKTKTHYARALGEISESAIHRGNLEALLRGKIFEDFAALCRFELSLGEHFYKYLILRGEINEILEFLRFFRAGRPHEYILTMPEFFNRHTPMDLLELSGVRDYDGFLRVIKDPGLHEVLAAFRPQDCGQIDYTMIEAVLDSYLYRWFFSLIEKDFSGGNRRELKIMFGRRAELDNVKMIYRAKKFYGAAPDAIRAKLIEHTGLISKRTLEQMVLAQSAEEVLLLLKKTAYGRAAWFDDMVSIDWFADMVMHRLSKKYMRFSTNPAVVMASCIILFELEVEDVTNIIEGIRYNMPAEEISRLLVCHTNF